MSVTLEHDNVLWLRAQAAASDKGSVSEVLDQLVTRARAEGQLEPKSIRSIAGTIDLPDDDPELEGADAYVRELFGSSLGRPALVRERKPQPRAKRSRRG